jgi:hypothetical protein
MLAKYSSANSRSVCWSWALKEENWYIEGNSERRQIDGIQFLRQLSLGEFEAFHHRRHFVSRKVWRQWAGRG